MPPPEAVKATGKAMRTTHGYIHPEDPPGTWRARRPHHHCIEPCSDWIPNGPPITDDYNKPARPPSRRSPPDLRATARAESSARPLARPADGPIRRPATGATPRPSPVPAVAA